MTEFQSDCMGLWHCAPVFLGGKRSRTGTHLSAPCTARSATAGSCVGRHRPRGK